MMRKALLPLALVAALSGCMGHDGLTRKALKFNVTAAHGRWTREALFVGMFIIPVYPLFKIVDLIFLNTIEYWTGSNPINGKKPLLTLSRSEVDQLGLEGIEVAQIEFLSDVQAALHVEFTNGDRVTFDVARDGDSYTISYAGVEYFRGKIEL